MEAEVKAELQSGNEVGWRVVVKYNQWTVTYRVKPDGEIKKVSWSGKRNWTDIPRGDREEIWNALQGWWNEKRRDRSRAVSFSPGDSHD